MWDKITRIKLVIILILLRETYIVIQRYTC